MADDIVQLLSQPRRQPQANPAPDLNFRYGTAKTGPYSTPLPLIDEMRFQKWVKDNNIPFEDSPTSDYDMRGFWQAAQNGDPAATTSINPFDGKRHYSDKWKTPYHK